MLVSIYQYLYKLVFEFQYVIHIQIKKVFCIDKLIPTFRFPLFNMYNFSIFSYGCVQFEYAGDEYFLFESIDVISAQNCVNKCLDRDIKYKFFMLSNFDE